MTYHWLVNSETTDAPDMNDNFQEVGSGSRLPTLINTSGAVNTTGVYDLGTTTARWNNLYCVDIDFSGDCSCFSI